MTTFQVIQGGGQCTGPTLAQSKQLGQRVIGRFVGPGGIVRFTDSRAVHENLLQMGFQLTQVSTHGVRPGGRQMFYQSGHVLVRLKTTGTNRRNAPHMTVSLARGGTGWDDEHAKFNAAGNLAGKTMRRAGSGGGRTSSFTVIECQMDAHEFNDHMDDWAHATHFNCVDTFAVSFAHALPLAGS